MMQVGRNEDSLEALSSRFTQYQNYNNAWYAEMRVAQSYYELAFEKEIVVPLDVKKPKIPPTAQTRVETAVLELIADQPQITRHREAHGERQKGYDDQIEQALKGFLLDNEEYSQTPVLHEACKLQLVRGATCLAGPFYDMKNERVWFYAYDPLNVLMEPGAFPREGFTHHTMTVAEMEQLAYRTNRFRGFTRDGKDALTPTTLVEWWEHRPPARFGRYAAWIQNDTKFLVPPRISGCPYMPLDMIYTGWGMRTPGAKPEQIARSMLGKGAQSLLRSEAEKFTMLDAAAAQSVWGRFRTPPGVTLPEGFVLSTLPNSISQDVPNEMVPFETPPMPSIVAQHYGLLQEMIDDALFSRVLAGGGLPGTRTATEASLQNYRSRKRFRPPVRLLQAGISRLLYRLGLLTHALGDLIPGHTFTFRGVKLEDRLYGDDYTVEVDLMTEDEETKRMKIAEGASLKGEVSLRTRHQDYYGTENSTAEVAQMIFESLAFSDEFKGEILNNLKLYMQAKAQGKPTSSVNPEETWRRLAALYRGAKTGFPPAQMGTVEGGAQQFAQGAGAAPMTTPTMGL